MQLLLTSSPACSSHHSQIMIYAIWSCPFWGRHFKMSGCSTYLDIYLADDVTHAKSFLQQDANELGNMSSRVSPCMRQA